MILKISKNYSGLGKVYREMYYRYIRIFLLSLLLVLNIGCGEDKLHLFKLEGDVRLGWLRTLPVIVHSVALDDNGNHYLAGRFEGTVDFDPGNGEQLYRSHGKTDAFILKLDRWGKISWVRTFGSQNSDSIERVVVDASGNCYMTGFFYGSVDFDPGLAEHKLTAQGMADTFILKLDSYGKFCWVKSINRNNDYENIFIQIDGSGNCYLAGGFTGSVDFDPSSANASHSSSGGPDIFLLKLDSQGAFVWVRTLGGVSYEIVNDMKTDSTGNCYLVGYFEHMADFDPGAGVETRTTHGDTDAFVVKLDADGLFCWVNSFGGDDGAVAYGVSVDTVGNCYVVGDFYSSVDFDHGPGVQNETSNGDSDAFVLKIRSSNGEFLWVNTFGGAADDRAISIGFDSAGNYYVAGYFSGSFDIDNGSGVQKLVAAGEQDGFVVTFGSDDLFAWGKRFGGVGVDWVTSVLLDKDDYLHLFGTFSGSVDFGNPAAPQPQSSTRATDSFYMKLPRQ